MADHDDEDFPEHTHTIARVNAVTLWADFAVIEIELATICVHGNHINCCVNGII